MKRTACLLLVAASIQAGPALACSCYLGDASEKLRRFDHVFLGTVTSVRRLGVANDMGEERIRVLFQVEQRWKGEGASATLETVHNRSSCFGYGFQPGERFVVYAHEGPWGGLDVWACGGAVPESDARFGQELGDLPEGNLVDR